MSTAKTPGVTLSRSPKLMAIERQLTSYARLNTTNALEVGAGVVGNFPFFLTLAGLAIVFISNVGLSAQQSVRADATLQENYFIATMVGMGLFVFGILLSLNQLSDVISFIRIAAMNSDESGPFLWNTAEQEAVRQASGIRLSEKEIAAQASESLRQAEANAEKNQRLLDQEQFRQFQRFKQQQSSSGKEQSSSNNPFK